ncbi:DNA primase [Acetobacterium bakii]|uniref:DNA primase n=1 Tax=Acetobacterium bakii TaxID=52689 RepID=A0A0L6U2E2_9FIRM|nr:DNA primase [Acetobacterium bakii]KNZ42689.1 DNA primase [Acetobacterium bakii]
MAAYYSEEVIQEVVEANDVVEVIADYMTLKRVGSSFKGKCPFHNEKTASFTVSREKQLYHCFGCGVGGNVITFIMEMEKLSFIDALKFLSTRGNVILPEKNNEIEDRQIYEKKQRLYDLHREGANYYFKCLSSSGKALNYLKKRGISTETIKIFGLGYSNENWDSLLTYLKTKGFTMDEMVSSGLVMQSENKRYYDRFRNRLMFPILNPRNQIVGFGGRIMEADDNGPKYLNSPETAIFSKSYELFNLNRSKNHLGNNQLLIVEGYMDVISLYEKGIMNTVASLGTAFTLFHAKILERYASEVIIAFDGDSAGAAATEKAMNILKKSNLNVKILILPQNEDPDSYIQKNGTEDFNMAISKAWTIVEYQLDLLKKSHDLTQTDGRIHFGNQAINILKELETSVEVDYYSKLVANDTGINAATIRREVIRSKNNQEKSIPTVVDFGKTKLMSQKIPKAYEKAQELAIRHCLKSPEMITEFPVDYLTNEFFHHLLTVISEEVRKNGVLDTTHLMNHFEDSEEVQKIVELVMNEEEVSRLDYQDALDIMKRFYKEAQIEELSEQIKKETNNGNEKEVARLTNQLIGIKKMMKENRRH